MGQQLKVPTQVGLRRQQGNAICNRGSESLKLPLRGLRQSPSHTQFLEILIEWSSFSSTVHHVRKTAQDFEQVDDVVITHPIKGPVHRWMVHSVSHLNQFSRISSPGGSSPKKVRLHFVN